MKNIYIIDSSASKTLDENKIISKRWKKRNLKRISYKILAIYFNINELLKDQIFFYVIS